MSEASEREVSERKAKLAHLQRKTMEGRNHKARYLILPQKASMWLKNRIQQKTASLP